MSRQLRSLVSALSLLAVVSPVPVVTALAAEEEPRWAAPPIAEAISVRTGRKDERKSFDELLDALAQADAVFLGESHIDETTHRLELAIYEGLLARREGQVVLAMEMFERDVQADLDAYLAGEIDEPTFLSKARPWGNYRTAYRPLIEAAKAAGRPVLASNFPRPLRRRMAMEGTEILETLEGDEKKQVPEKLFPNTKAYWERVDNAVRGHRSMMGGTSDEDRLVSTQSLWDNSMGETCARALDEHEGSSVLHVNGGFHSLYWDGTVHQLRLRKPDAKVLTVAIVSTPSPHIGELSGVPAADFVVFVESRANDINNGTWSVETQRSVEYRLHFPENMDGREKLPLLIWLTDDGLTAKDGLSLWRERLGDEAILAVFETPHRAVAADLGAGGRWFWPESFGADIGTMASAMEKAWAYLLRHYPIDPSRVCMAGEGTGATVVASATLLGDRIETNSVALSPRRYAKIKDFPLPLPAYRGEDEVVAKSLKIVTSEDGDEWWKTELAEYDGIGLDNELLRLSDDPFQVEQQQEDLLRSALGLKPRLTLEEGPRHAILTGEGQSDRSKYWARLLALRQTKERAALVAAVSSMPAGDQIKELKLDISASAFADQLSLPRCPGPFGGTTVVALPEGTSQADREAWLALMEDDPLTKKSRFHRMRVATSGGELALAKVLRKLSSEGRNNVLIVPSVFCADTDTMQRMLKDVRELGNQMTLHWLPGLGARLALPPPKDPGHGKSS